MDKLAGPTSHDVVQQVRRALGTRSVGHAGTLDPFATGLLVLLVGRATRLARFVEGCEKTYLATARLGVATDTDDPTGAVLPGGIARHVEDAELAAALASLAGAQRQRPPAYSAKHVAGERSYRLARRGAAVELAETPVVVHDIELVARKDDLVTFRTTVSAGTYVRAMARDLGERLGTGAHLTQLRRERIGDLSVTEAVQLSEVGPEMQLVPPARLVSRIPAHETDSESATAVGHGRAIRGAAEERGFVALIHAGKLLAIAEADGAWLRPRVVLEGA